METSRTTTYVSQDGVHIDHVEHVYPWAIFLWVFVFAYLTSDLLPTSAPYTPTSFGLAVGFAVTTGLVIAIFWPIRKVRAIQQLLHKHTMIPWAQIELIEMNRRRLVFTYISNGKKHSSSVTVKPGQEASVIESFSKSFGPKFICKR